MRAHVYIIISLCIVTGLQISGPIFYGFAPWCNVIQYVSGFAYAGALAVALHVAVHYFTVHRPQLQRIEEHLKHLRKEREL
ncbi:hypothetical protein [Alicyclobacillus suci]|uniref:hypothetical protein n=1 Tax=Alicyclobacillus suci TaxID=2816080 RepID=UPI001A8E0908|nr:hypothetical protein [Alicyclobacillus suci]